MESNDIQILQEDMNNIYLGNIFTVEADINLPTIGKNGSKINWLSNKEYLVSSNGEVRRPHAGTGDREVVLTATLMYNRKTATKKFTLTVLEIENKVKPIKAIDNLEVIEIGSEFNLPTVTVVENEDGSLTTLPISWGDILDFTRIKVGEYVFNALTDEKHPNIAAKTILKVVDKLPKQEIPVARLSFYKPDAIKVTGGIYKNNQKLMETYLLNVSDDSMLYNFRLAAGLDTKDASPMLGWDAPESLLKGHTTGHYLSAIALACNDSDDNKATFAQKIRYMVEGLYECQLAMERSGKYAYGFLSGYSEEQFDLLEEYVVYPKIWAPYYTLHKILAGLLDCYEYQGSKKSLEIAEKLGIWVYNRLAKLDNNALNKMWAMYIAGEYGGMNESMARLHRVSPKEEYLKTAKFFDNDKLYLPMVKNINTLGGMHANQHIPPMVGTLMMFEQSGEKKYYDMSYNFWRFVTQHHIYNIGGIGHGEMFQQPDKLIEFLSDKNAESCASYNMLKLTAELFKYTPYASYMDYYEKTLINHIVATLDPHSPSGESMYFTPLELGGVKEYRSDSNSCCHGTGMESPFRYSHNIYAKGEDKIFVNLFMPSVLTDRELDIELEQQEDFLITSKVSIVVSGSGNCRLALRIPSWYKKNITVLVNGNPVGFKKENGYAVLEEPVKSGDIVTMNLPFSFYTEKAPDDDGVYALYYGPLVLGAESSSKEYIKLPIRDDLLEQKITKTGDLSFSYNGYVLKPNCMIVESPHHFYFSK